MQGGTDGLASCLSLDQEDVERFQAGKAEYAALTSLEEMLQTGTLTKMQLQTTGCFAVSVLIFPVFHC